MIKWLDEAENKSYKVKVVKFLPKGSPQGFETSSEDVWIVELLESHTNGVRHIKGERVFANLDTLIIN